MRRERKIPAEALAAIAAPFEGLDAIPLDPPMVQPLALVLDLAGEALRERLFIVQSEGSAEFCLRPDFTLAAIEALIESGRGEGAFTYQGSAFRAAPRGESRSEQFLQIGLERFGPGEAPRDDAAMAALAWRSALAGGRDDLELVLGDVGLFAAFVERLDIPAARAARLERAFASPQRLDAELRGEVQVVESDPLARRLAGMTEADAMAALEETWAQAGVRPIGGRGAQEIVRRLMERRALSEAPTLTEAQRATLTEYLDIDATPEQALKRIAALAPGLDLAPWTARLEALAADGVEPTRMRLVTRFGHGLSYYDGVFFEIRSRALDPATPVAVGGRYDGLPARLGAKDCQGAVGCMVRPGRAWAGGVA